MRFTETFADSTETTECIIVVIAEICDNDPVDMFKLWDNPTHEQFSDIITQAFASTDDDELCWGETVIHRQDYD